jgi:hypothetical protein
MSDQREILEIEKEDLPRKKRLKNVFVVSGVVLFILATWLWAMGMSTPSAVLCALALLSEIIGMLFLVLWKK